MSAVPVEEVGVRAPPESPVDAWRLLSAAQTADALCQAWLQVLARSLVSARTATLLLSQPDGSFAPVAVVPAGRDTRYLADIATQALRERAGAVARDDQGQVHCAYPLQSGTRLLGAVVLDLGAASAAALEQAQRLTHWGAGWLLELVNQRELTQERRRGEQTGFVLQALVATLQEPSAREAGLVLVHQVARQLRCRQVLLAVRRGAGRRRHTLKMLAMSHAAWFDERAGLVNQALQAMHEALDQRRAIRWPLPEGGGDAPVALAHARYAGQGAAPCLCSLPLDLGTEVVGVLMCERDDAFTDEDLACLEALGLSAAAAIEARREADRGVLARACERGRQLARSLAGPSHPAAKLGVGVAALLVGVAALVPGTYRVPAPAVVEGAVQRAAVAPFEGFVREAPARAGDVVKAGQLLAALDDRDLKLERLRWEAELEVAQQKEREAMAKGNRVDQRLAAAQANQARAQLDLALARLARVQVVAPFDGVVVKGDLSQQLGSPVEQGKVLFELAPLDAWRVILKVDHRDIAHVQPGAAGALRLSSLPGNAWPFQVRQVTPISVAEDGRTFFRVEAELDRGAPALRPNMEGVGKIEAGRHSLLWIWTHAAVDWLRLGWWKLLP